MAESKNQSTTPMFYQPFRSYLQRTFCIFQSARLLLLVFMIIFFAGCKSLRNLGIVDTTLSTAEMAMLDVQTNQPWPEWYSARFSGKAEWDGKTQSLAGTMRMKKDSAIYISIAPLLGIEVARVLITPDSIKIINRLESIYYSGDIGALSQKYKADVDLKMLQAMLLGNDFPGFETSMFEMADDPNFIKLIANERSLISGASDPFRQTITIMPESWRIRTNILEQPSSGRAIRADYLNFETIDGKLIPNNLKLSFGDDSGISSLELNLSRFVLNEPQSLQFSVPSSYTRVRLTE